MTNTHRSSFMKERFFLTHSSRLLSVTVGVVSWQEPGSWSHCLCSHEAESNGCWCPVHFCLSSSGPQPRKGGAHIRMAPSPPQSDRETPSWTCQDAWFEILSRRPSALTITGTVWEEGTESGGSLGRKDNGGAYGQSTRYT